MRRAVGYISLIIILGVSLMACSSRSPSEELLRRSTEEIREYLLELAPIGSGMDDIIMLIEESETWEIWNIDRRNGFPMVEGDPLTIGNYVPGAIIVGTQSMRVELGRYRHNIFALYLTYVTTFWAFDNNSMLIDVQVRK